METKTCTRCHQEKPLNQFTITKVNNRSKIYAHCKICIAEERRIAVAANPEKYARYQREYNEKNREKVRDYNRESYPARADAQRNNARYWRQRFPEKHRAGKILRHAVECGIVKKTPCIVCGSENVEAHHPNYSKPLEVVWLCHSHHFRVHHQEVIKMELPNVIPSRIAIVTE